MSVASEHGMVSASSRESAELESLATMLTEVRYIPRPKRSSTDRPDAYMLTAPDGVTLPIPTEVLDAVRRMVVALAAGNMVEVKVHESILTTGEAAELLGVTRPTLVKLLNEGEIPFERPGRHRRVQLRDVLAYQQRRREQQYALLAQMSAEAGEFDTGEPDQFVPTR